MDPFIGTITLFGFNFAPRGWAKCEGQLLSIAQNQALFSLLGTTYGGDGRTTFALPDLRGRTPLGSGQGPGLEQYEQGTTGGAETVTLQQNQMPAHSHSLNANSAAGNTASPTNAIFASTGAVDREYHAGGVANTAMSGQIIGPSGGSQAHENRQPYLVLNYCIALEGIYPSRN